MSRATCVCVWVLHWMHYITITVDLQDELFAVIETTVVVVSFYLQATLRITNLEQLFFSKTNLNTSCHGPRRTCRLHSLVALLYGYDESLSLVSRVCSMSVHLCPPCYFSLLKILKSAAARRALESFKTVPLLLLQSAIF